MCEQEFRVVTAERFAMAADSRVVIVEVWFHGAPVVGPPGCGFATKGTIVVVPRHTPKAFCSANYQGHIREQVASAVWGIAGNHGRIAMKHSTHVRMSETSFFLRESALGTIEAPSIVKVVD